MGAGILALAIIVATWRFFPPPLPRRRARLSLGLRALIVVLLTASLAGVITVLHDPAHLSYVALPGLSKTCKNACRPLPVPNLIRG